MIAAGKTEFLNLPLHTEDSVALSYLMSETLFDVREAAKEVSTGEEIKMETNTPVEFIYLGKNLSGFLFVFQDVSRAGQHRMPDEEMEAFEKILTALKLSVEDIALLNIADPGSITLAGLLTFFRPQKTVLLGTDIVLNGIEDLSNPPALHRTISYQQTEFLHTFSFTEMMTDVDKKRQFWNSLKTLLGG